ncbi:MULTISPECIES: hypothetical protein [unclassified Halomonas]|uniref:hypothetical protein n=1 Tax=unclassified Halomonas TaxID=2609666 RepID=UPI000B08E51E|nr:MULTISPECIES: hypothetical protein [unclassified Halomonas]MCO7215029.1 hypothetical protein [Halomonas sp. OfavH-34-E]
MHQGRVRIRGGELCEQNGLRVNVPLASRSVGAALLIGTLAISPGVLAEQELGQAASDPTAPLMNFQLQNSWSPEVHGTNDSQNIVQFRTALPYRLAGHQHIFRLTVPSLTEDPGGSTGLSDSTVFDLTTFEHSWGRSGFGVVALLPTGGEHRGAEQWGLGPAVGFAASRGSFLYGAFNQNILSVAGEDDREDVNLSILQPIINLGLGQGWSVGTSEMNITYDWEHSDWSSLPVGGRLSKLVKLGDSPLQISGLYEHNFADDYAVPEDQFSLQFKLLVP